MQSVVFPNKILPYFLVAPQIILTIIFFFWPASQALYQSAMREDPFGLQSNFVGLANFRLILSDENYLHALQVTIIFSVATALLSMGLALLLATAADLVVRGKGFYRTLMIIPYAVAPAVAGMLWLFMFNPAMGTLAYILRRNGIAWDPLLDGSQAMTLVVIPQGVRRVLPALMNQFIALIKDSSLIYFLGLLATQRELFAVGRDLNAQTGNLSPLVAAGLVYLLLTIPLTHLVNYIDHRMRTGRPDQPIDQVEAATITEGRG